MHRLLALFRQPLPGSAYPSWPAWIWLVCPESSDLPTDCGSAVPQVADQIVDAQMGAVEGDHYASLLNQIHREIIEEAPLEEETPPEEAAAAGERVEGGEGSEGPAQEPSEAEIAARAARLLSPIYRCHLIRFKVRVTLSSSTSDTHRLEYASAVACRLSCCHCRGGVGGATPRSPRA